MSTIVRAVQSTSAKEVSTATWEGWNLTFTTETSNGGVFITVTVTGQKGDSYLNGHANSEPSSSISFSQGIYDAVVASAIAAEMEAIVSA